MRSLRIAAVVALLTGYLFGLLWFLPASLVWQQIAGQLPGDIQVQKVQGTVWRGRVLGLHLQGLDHGQLSWKVRPSGLLRLRLVADLHWLPRQGQVSARLLAAPGRLQLSSVQGELDAQGMAALHRAPFILEGRWLLDIERIELAEPSQVTHAEGWLTWRGGAAGLPVPLALGDLQAALRAEDGWLTLTLADQGGPLGLRGNARWQPTRPMFLDTGLQARPQADPALGSALSLLGRADAEGWIEWEASLQ